MAISPGFGIVCTTAVTLLLAPCLDVILEDLAGLRSRQESVRSAGFTA